MNFQEANVGNAARAFIVQMVLCVKNVEPVHTVITPVHRLAHLAVQAHIALMELLYAQTVPQVHTAVLVHPHAQLADSVLVQRQ
jgi:hypothetical protein